MLRPFALSHSNAFAAILSGQQNSFIVDWLTAVQAIETKLRMSPDVNVTSELRSVHYEIAQWNAAHSDQRIDVPGMVAQSANVLQHVSALGHALEEHERALLDRNDVHVRGYPEAGRNWYVNHRYRF